MEEGQGVKTDPKLLEERREFLEQEKQQGTTWGSGETSQQTDKEKRFVCDVCGREFKLPQALGSHKSRAHGVAGKSGRNQARKPRQEKQPVAARETKERFDTDRLLADLFPTGIPARKETLDAVTGWLAEAERLSNMR